jgi:hypothetical protein
MKEFYLLISTNTPKQYFRISKVLTEDELKEAKERFDLIAKDPNTFSVHLVKAQVIEEAGPGKDVFGNC